MLSFTITKHLTTGGAHHRFQNVHKKVNAAGYGQGIGQPLNTFGMILHNSPREINGPLIVRNLDHSIDNNWRGPIVVGEA